ncbi:MAG TPA: hypothetical protein VKB75_01315 [Jatrophihabitans sp.]|nr:hypothetical protein [Jatrophihabitans sp.]
MRRTLLWWAVAAFTFGLCTPAHAAQAPLLFRFADPRITEASGIAAGLVSPGVVYVHNDSGDTNRFFAVDAHSGVTVATIIVPGARNIDWEDIAVARDAAGRSSVWLADTGDNDASRREVQVYRVDEPRLRANQRDRVIRARLTGVWRVHYPDGPVDTESLAVTPNGNGYLVTKSPGLAAVYRLPASPDAHRVRTLTKVGTIRLVPTGAPNPFGPLGEVTATSAAISADGSLLAVRTYATAYLWRVAAGGVPAALRNPPVRVPLPWQRQGEGVAVAAGRLLVDSEGLHSPVYAVPLPRLPAATTAPRSSPAAHPAAPAPRSRGGAGWALPVVTAAAACALLAGAVAWRLRRRR